MCVPDGRHLFEMLAYNRSMEGYYTGCFKKGFTTSKTDINLFKGYVQLTLQSSDDGE
jgi:hypothetical protein